MPAERPLAPFGRRSCNVASFADDGGYRLFTLIDDEGPVPAPGQFYMLTEGPDWLATSGSPFLPPGNFGGSHKRGSRKSAA
jgi:hypothetical protein